MVEYVSSLDLVFAALADPTRRDILGRLQQGALTVSKIARSYDMSLAAVSKHLQILERSQLVVKQKRGRERYVAVAPAAIHQAAEYLQQYG